MSVHVERGEGEKKVVRRVPKTRAKLLVKGDWGWSRNDEYEKFKARMHRK